MLKLIVIYILSTAAFGAGAAEGEHHEIPWGLIIKQAVNFGVVIGVLIYLLKNKIGEFFRDRAASFDKLVVLARKAKEDAETQKRDISARLERLQATAQDSVEQAKREAEELKAKIQAEAKLLAEQIRQDAMKTAEREVHKAKQELREEVLSQAMKTTREVMKTSVKEVDQTRLQNEFVEKIQVGQ